MADIEKVIKGLEHCIAEGKDCRGCIYYEQMINEKESCACRSDALDVIRDLQSQIAMLVVAQHELCELLKEQEAKHPVCEKCSREIDHINTSVFNYDGSDSDYSIPITYSKENGCISFSTSQKWTGYDLTDKEQKEIIRCPYCGKFPFDDSIEIEFYEPVEVMMWTSEGR